ncbi:MAG TPA: DUF1343 domain-containing protein [Lutibacter sp.]|nr:DUF1343 domain-containing protein [Lutibacter sp.]
MRFKNTYFFLVSVAILVIGCKTNPKVKKEALNTIIKDTINLYVGASQLEDYLFLLKDKKVAVVGNQTSIIQNLKLEIKNKNTKNYTHLVDTLLALDVNVVKVFSPEHGFRGKADAGEKVVDGIDSTTGLPIISLYGSNKKPKAKQLEGIDILLFDLQDVGVRFYTYISTLHYVMEAAAENNIPLVVLDRPNPNAHYVDGPIIEDKHKSFVGMHPVPIVYGMTIGEYAKMINGENWLQGGIQCDLSVVKLKNYNHKTKYNLPVKPSPNLPNAKSIELYPSLCFFEGTTISCGRGTETQFQVFGHPDLEKKHFPYTFTPKPNEGAKQPKNQGLLCYGLDLTNTEVHKINLQWLIDAYTSYPKDKKFFNSFFTKLAGTEKLQKQIELGYTHRDIRKEWVRPLLKFKKTRAKYLLYE